jgi:hypothetical protein
LGAFIGSNGTTGRLSLKSATNSLKWDGSTLDITGNINIAGGTAATQITDAAASGSVACAAALTANTAAGNANTKAIHACNCSYTALERSVDSTGKITFAPTPAGNGLFLSSTHLGFYCCTAWKTYMNNGGCFFLSGGGTNQLTWDTTTLTVVGNINITGGTAATQITNAASSGSVACAAALTAFNCGVQGKTDASNANDKATHACNCSYTALSRSVDSVGKITFAPTPAGNGLFLSSTHMGFYCCTAWKTYMNSGGCFFLSGAGTNSLTWDTNNLVICGNGVFSGTVTAGAGLIGGWSIQSTKLCKNGIVFDSSIPEISYLSGCAKFQISTGYINDVASSSGTITCTTYIGDGGQLWLGVRDASSNLKNYIRFDNTSDYTRAIFFDDGTTTYTDEMVWIYKPTDSNSAALRVTGGGIQASVTGTANFGHAIVGGGSATFTGDVIANTSDKRLKTNIINIDSPLEKISKINGVYFNWNELAKELSDKNTEIREVGFIAQEVQVILPEIIKPAAFDVLLKTGQNYLTIQYEKIVPLLVESIKQLKRELDELKCKR